jgi:hypothetical protein
VPARSSRLGSACDEQDDHCDDDDPEERHCDGVLVRGGFYHDRGTPDAGSPD